jgi:hypothetical protein
LRSISFTFGAIRVIFRNSLLAVLGARQSGLYLDHAYFGRGRSLCTGDRGRKKGETG